MNDPAEAAARASYEAWYEGMIGCAEPAWPDLHEEIRQRMVLAQRAAIVAYMAAAAPDRMAEALTWIEDVEPDGDEDVGQTGWHRTGEFIVPDPQPDYPETVDYVDRVKVADFVLWARDQIPRLRAVLTELVEVTDQGLPASCDAWAAHVLDEAKVALGGGWQAEETRR